LRTQPRLAAGGAVLAVALAVALAGAAPSFAHETLASGPLRVTLGWAQEPAYTGVENFVEVSVADAAGAPVPDVGTELTAEVSFGPATRVLPLVPGGRPGVLRAALVPTRAGGYAFHVTGTVGGQPIDVASTCSETTFDCVTDVAAIQFPANDPSAGEMAERVRREAARAEEARDEATEAHGLALIAMGVAVAALVLSGVLVARARRGRSQA
jgi:hypothetical protein